MSTASRPTLPVHTLPCVFAHPDMACSRILPLPNCTIATQAQGKAPLQVKEGSKPWYYERLGFRPLTRPLTEEQLAAATASILSMRDRPYEKESGDMVKAAVDLCECCCSCTVNTDERRESLFCSEFVAAVYIDSGLLPKSPVAGEYVPSDFGRDHGCNMSSLCCCCWLSWTLARCCGVGDLRQHGGGGRLFKKEILLKTPIPPRAGTASKAAVV